MINRQLKSGVRIAVGTVLMSAGLMCVPVDAQVVQVSRGESRNLVGFNLGYFALRGEDSRGGDEGDDVLLANLNAGRGALLFDVSDFNGVTFGGEWLFGVTDFLETGVGIGFYQNTVHSIYAELVDVDGTEIEQDLKLRVVPLTATLRFLPLGRGAAVEPYVGAGIGIFNWRYSETGEFVDLSDDTIFRDRFSADGNAVGPVVLAGLRAPIGDVFTVGGEIRWQHAEGDTDAETSGLLADKIDLGGWTTNFAVHFRF